MSAYWRVVRVGVSLALFVGLAGSPVPAAADGRDGTPRDVTLYELTETAEFTVDGSGTPVARVATSALQGKARPGSPLCPRALLDVVFPGLPFEVMESKRCVISAVGHSTLSLATFGGTIDGDLAVVVNTEETNPVDAAELVVMTGTFEGTIQVTDPAGVIITLLGGTFKPVAVIGGLTQPALCAGLGICDATFTGTFRLPFKARHWAVYKKDSGRLEPVRPNERALGDPTVRLEVNFD